MTQLAALNSTQYFVQIIERPFAEVMVMVAFICKAETLCFIQIFFFVCGNLAGR